MAWFKRGINWSHMNRVVGVWGVLFLLGACEQASSRMGNFLSQMSVSQTVQDPKVLTNTGVPKSAAELDKTTQAQREAALVNETDRSESTELGTTIAALGSPAQVGFWLKTPLVKKERTGRVVVLETGKSAKVTLIPLTGEGSGSQLSLSAMRLLELPLTGLVEISVNTL